jgi:hypothetical protein
MAQANALIAGLSTRDSSLQISTCTKQEDLAVSARQSRRPRLEPGAELSALYLIQK